MKKDLNFDQGAIFNTDAGRDRCFDDEDMAMETPVPNNKLTPTQDMKTLNQLKANRTKKIFG